MTTEFSTQTINCFGQTITLPVLEDPKRNRRLRHNLENAQWEPDTFQAIDRFVDRDTDYVDIGVWIGATVFYGARKARRVFAVEPDPVSIARLQALIPCNEGNITLIPRALSDQESVQLKPKKTFGESSSSVLHSSSAQSVKVSGITLREIIAQTDRPVFIKIDIEGLEYYLEKVIFDIDLQRVKGMQIAVHPHLYARSLRNHLFRKRWRTYKKTLELFRDRTSLQRCNPASLPGTARRHIFWRRKMTGWDILYHNPDFQGPGR